MDRGRIGVFVGYELIITRQYRIYAPDLGYVTRSSVVRFIEDKQGGNIDLKLRIAKTAKAVPGVPRPGLATHNTYNPGTLNILPMRKPQGRPLKTTIKEPSIIQDTNLPDPEADDELSSNNISEKSHQDPSKEPAQTKAPPHIFSHVEITKKRPCSNSDYLIIPEAKYIKAMLAMIVITGCEIVHSVKNYIILPKSYNNTIQDAIYSYQ
jgi:hypothetical protein